MTFPTSILDLFITSAHADTGAPAPQGSMLPFIVMLFVFVILMYFLTLRPQSKRAKEHRELLNSLTKGDEVVTVGGILGKITKITDNYIMLALTEGVEIAVQKSAIDRALPKGTLKSIN